MKRIALLLLLPVFMLSSAPRDRAFAEAPEARQQEALAAIRQYARDMMIVLPCFYMATPPAMWVKAFGEPEVNETLAIYGNIGASAAQVDALRKAYVETFQPQWVGDIRVMAKACHDNNIFDAMFKIMGPATPLNLRPPFRKSP